MGQKKIEKKLFVTADRSESPRAVAKKRKKEVSRRRSRVRPRGCQNFFPIVKLTGITRKIRQKTRKIRQNRKIKKFQQK